MTAEELPISTGKPEFSDSEGATILFIMQCLKNACKPFKKACKQASISSPLNENKYTQIFVEQVEVFLKSHPSIGVKNQYSDTFFGTKGVPDFYFHRVEEGVHHQPIFIGEAKILPTPGGKAREKEYVVGESNNGGMERFKLERHGKGVDFCCLLAFVLSGSIQSWRTRINKWIVDLSTNQKKWHREEILKLQESSADYGLLNSTMNRISGTIKLLHLWIKFD